MNHATLVAGVGNVFLGDDGFGVEVARKLAHEPLPDGVQVADYGIRAAHLAYELLEGYDTVILVDAVKRGKAPGTVSVIEEEVPPRPAGACLMQGGTLDPAAVLALTKQLGGQVGRVVLVGCEPADVDEHIGLSEPVERAVEEAAKIVRRLVSEGDNRRS